MTFLLFVVCSLELLLNRGETRDEGRPCLSKWLWHQDAAGKLHILPACFFGWEYWDFVPTCHQLCENCEVVLAVKQSVQLLA